MLVKRTSTKNWWVNIFNRFIISQQYTAFLYVRLSTSVVFRQHSHTTCTALIIPFVHFLWKLSPYITCFFIFICRQRKIVRHSANKAYFPFFCLFTHLMNIHGSYNIQQLELFTFRQRLKEFDLIWNFAVLHMAQFENLLPKTNTLKQLPATSIEMKWK